MVIDLDRAVPPSRARPRPVLRPGGPALIPAVLLLVLLLGAAQPRPRIPDLPLVAATTSVSGPWLLTGTMLYTTHARTGSRMDVVARSLATGEVLWQRDMEWWAEVPDLAEAGPTLVVTGGDSAQTRMFDGRTGADRLDPERYPVMLPVGDRVALWGWMDRKLALYDPAADRILWNRPFEHDLRGAVATGDHLLAVDDTGTAGTYAMSNGAPAGPSGRVFADGAESDVRVVDARAYLLGPRTVTSVRLPDLRTLWTVALSMPRVVVRCGTLLCVSGAAGTSALDLGTGRTAWRNLDWTGGVAGPIRTAGGHGVLVDPESGAVRADLGPGLPVGDLLLRGGPDVVDVVAWATGRIHGRLPGSTPSGCRRTGDHLACQQADHLLKVWRLP